MSIKSTTIGKDNLLFIGLCLAMYATPFVVQFGLGVDSRPAIVFCWSLLSLSSLLLSHRFWKAGMAAAEVVNAAGFVRNLQVYLTSPDDLHLVMLAIIAMTFVASLILGLSAEHNRRQHQMLAAMNQRLGELALTDEQTGAYNHRYFDKRLDEFAVIVPEVPVELAQLLAQRLRSAVQAEPFVGEENQPQGDLTISVGLSIYPMWAKTADELVQQADEALYQAKHMSRNRVEVYADIVEQLKGDAAGAR